MPCMGSMFTKNLANCRKNIERKANCSKGKVVDTIFSKSMERETYFSKNMERKANCSKGKVVDTIFSKSMERGNQLQQEHGQLQQENQEGLNKQKISLEI